MREPEDPGFGPFAFQSASETRIVEYPWAFHTARLAPGMRVLDAGGGLSGLQYVLAMVGCDVVNADPTARDDYNVWSEPGFVSLTSDLHSRLNTVFGTHVRLVADRVQDAELPAESFDRVLCLSTLEHLEPAEAAEVLAAFGRLVTPEGLVLLTVDVFLDLRPFGILDTNTWGRNHNVWELVTDAGFELVDGDPRELLGSPRFDLDRVVRLVPELLIGSVYPVMTQTLSLRRRQR